MNIQIRITSVLLTVLLLAACGNSSGSGSGSNNGISNSTSNGMTGTYAYADSQGSVSITFSPDGTALLKLDQGGDHMAPTVRYSMEDGKIVLHSPTGKGGDVTLTRNPDGSLQSPWGPQPLKPQR